MREAEVLLVGGHSVEDNETKYGLSVTGIIHPDRILLNHGARNGDRLILTKPLGTGIVSTAVKGNLAPDALFSLAVQSMTTLNRKAAELVIETPGVHACTDVTGFGLLGHACEMLGDGQIGMVIDSATVPVFPGIRDLAEMGMLPGGLYRNRDFRSGQVEMAPSCPQWLQDILFDPQTAGGLLVALDAKQADGLVRKMHDEGVADAAVIGDVTTHNKGKIIIK